VRSSVPRNSFDVVASFGLNKVLDSRWYALFRVLARGTSTSLKLVNKDGREQLIKPQ